MSKSDKQNIANNINNKFIDIHLSPEVCDIYIIRKNIQQAITDNISLFKGIILDIGCGQMPYRDYILQRNQDIKKYIGLDFYSGKYAKLKKPDLTWDGKKIPLAGNHIDCAMATEVLEHCPQPINTLKEIKRVLKPGGVFFFTVPFLWPLHDTPHDYYRYTPYSLQELLREAGFENIKIKSMGGWNASLAQMLGLWLKRAPMPQNTRQQALQDLFPFYESLIKTDISPQNFNENPMLTSLSGTAISAK